MLAITSVSLACYVVFEPCLGPQDHFLTVDEALVLHLAGELATRLLTGASVFLSPHLMIYEVLPVRMSESPASNTAMVEHL